MKDVYALFLHGIGTQGSDFCDEARLHLDQGLKRYGARSYARPVHYAPLLDKASARFLAAVKKAGSKGNIIQTLSSMVISDALQYDRNEKVRQEIQYLIDYEYTRLRPADTLTIFAHSLGCLVTLDWLRSRTGVKNVRLVTMGCNLGLFDLGRTMDVPIQVEQPGDWLNLFDPSDGIGYPLNIGEHPELCHVRDHKVEVGGLIAGSTGLAHMAYFGDEDLWRKTIPALLSKA